MNEPLTLRTTKQDHLIAGFAALAIAVHLLESAIPSPLPGIKPGLANVIVLIVLLRHGLRAAVWVGLIRVLAGSLITGTFMTPTFMIGLSGQLASLAGLAALVLLLGRRVGPIGLAVVAAMCHVSGQLFTAWALFIPHPGVILLLPWLSSAAMLLGLFSGWVCLRLIRELPECPA